MNIRELDGRRVLVTGASSGIGRACALAAGRAGARVAVNYRKRPEGAEEVVREIAGAGGHAVPVQADVSDEDDVAAMFERVLEAFGGLDLLVGNAGIQRDAALVEMSLEDWRRVIDVNLTGQFLCARAAVRHWLERAPTERPARAIGNIVFVSSIHQIIPWAGHTNYAASKGGLASFMTSLAQEVAHRKIRVNAVAPGAIKTPINEEVWSDPDERKQLLERIPYGRIGEPEDVANAVLWLASDASDYVTGETLVIGGGMRLYPAFRDGG